MQYNDLEALNTQLMQNFPAVDPPVSILYDFSTMPANYRHLNIRDFDSMRRIHDRTRSFGLEYTLIISPPAVNMREIFVMTLSGKDYDIEKIIAAADLKSARRFLASANRRDS